MINNNPYRTILDVPKEHTRSLREMGFPYLTVCFNGHIWNQRIGRWVPQSLDRRGYPRVGITTSDGQDKTVRVHTLVAKAFHPNPLNLPQVNHIDGDKTNNHVDNLEWCTNLENARHSRLNGLMPHNVLTEENVHHICRLIVAEWSVSKIVKEFNYPKSSVASIRTKRNWTWISSQYEFPLTFTWMYLDDAAVHGICKLISCGLRDGYIAGIYSCDPKTINRIRMRKARQNISAAYSW